MNFTVNSVLIKFNNEKAVVLFPDTKISMKEYFIDPDFWKKCSFLAGEKQILFDIKDDLPFDLLETETFKEAYEHFKNLND